MEKFFKIKTRYLYFIISLVSLLITYFLQLRIYDFNVFANLAGDQFSYEQLESMFELQKKYTWIGFVVAPFFLLIKTAFAALFIHMVLIFVNFEIKFKDVFKLNLIAGSVYILASLFQLGLVYFSDIENINQSLLEISSLSLALFFEKDQMLIPFYSFLSNISPYELLYILITVFGIKHITQTETKKSIMYTGIIWFSFTGFIVIMQSFIELTLM
jgi:hypothetical protein